MSENESKNIETMPPLSMFGSIKRATIGLALFAIVTAGLIAATQQLTAERIEEQIRIAKSKALFEIIPPQEHDNSMLEESFKINVDSLGLEDWREAHIARQQGELVAMIFPVIAPDGYSGEIRLIVGIGANGVLRGVRVVSHQETPGLGDKIETQKSNWIFGFEGRSLSNPSPEQWLVKKDGGEFDQLTGATITPRSIVAAVKRTLDFFNEYQTVLKTVEPGDQVSKDYLVNALSRQED